MIDQIQPVVPETPKSENWFHKHLIAVCVSIVAIIVGGGLVYYFQQPVSVDMTPVLHKTPDKITETPSATFPTFPSNSIVGQFKLLNQDLGLIVATEADKLNNFTPEVKYYDGGTIVLGTYKDFHRIIVTASYEGIGGPAIYIFATKDYKTYMFDKTVDAQSDIYKWCKDNPAATNLNCTKITKEDFLPTNHPPILDTGDNNFVVLRSQIYLGTGSEFELENSKKAKPLASKDPNLKIYAEPLEISGSPANPYLDSTSSVLVQDQTGLTYYYVTIDHNGYERGKASHPEYYYTGYSDDAAIYKSDITNNEGLYDQYGGLLPTGCATEPVYALKGISDSDLVYVGQKSSGQQFYVFKDLNHPLIKENYRLKVGQYSPEDYLQWFEKAQPSYEQFISKAPMIITKDPWSRWLVFGETTYPVIGGCGKPVIYLYPTKPTAVEVKFSLPMKLTVDIPKYAEGWKVLADPSGQLEDLQPEQTDCSKINSSAFGSEYAVSACEANTYPYLYWAGFTSQKYPLVTKGFVVSASDLQNFLEEKLSYIGFNSAEISDVISYWEPKMLKKEAPFYRITFLQNSELNRLFPMSVVPQPDSTIRIFLDWSPLDAPVNITPQKLLQYARRGFSYVEWGGLNQ